MIEYIDLQFEEIQNNNDVLIQQTKQDYIQEKAKIQKIQKIKQETEQQYQQIKNQYQKGDKTLSQEYNEAKLVRKQIQSYVKNFIEQSMKNDLYHELFFPKQDIQENEEVQLIEPTQIEDFIEYKKNCKKQTSQKQKLQELQEQIQISRIQPSQNDEIPNISQLLQQQKSRTVIKSEQEQFQDALELQKSILNSQDPRLKQILDIIPPQVNVNQSIDELQKTFEAKLQQSQNRKSMISVTECSLLNTEQLNATTDTQILKHQIHILQQDNIVLKTRNKFLEQAMKTQDETIERLHKQIQEMCQNDQSEQITNQLKENLQMKQQIKDMEMQFAMYKQQVKQDISIMKQHFIDQVNNYRQLLSLQKLNQKQDFRRSESNINQIKNVVFECEVEQKGEDLNKQFDKIDADTIQELTRSQLQIESTTDTNGINSSNNNITQLQDLKKSLTLLKQSK